MGRYMPISTMWSMDRGCGTETLTMPIYHPEIPCPYVSIQTGRGQQERSKWEVLRHWWRYVNPSSPASLDGRIREGRATCRYWKSRIDRTRVTWIAVAIIVDFRRYRSGKVSSSSFECLCLLTCSTFSTHGSCFTRSIIVKIRIVHRRLRNMSGYVTFSMLILGWY